MRRPVARAGSILSARSGRTKRTCESPLCRSTSLVRAYRRRSSFAPQGGSRRCRAHGRWPRSERPRTTSSTARGRPQRAVRGSAPIPLSPSGRGRGVAAVPVPIRRTQHHQSETGAIFSQGSFRARNAVSWNFQPTVGEMRHTAAVYKIGMRAKTATTLPYHDSGLVRPSRFKFAESQSTR
jgi:hypothetical protein